MDDLISRQAAIERINKQREHLEPNIFPQDKIGDAAYQICTEFIERLPSAQQWIPIKTRPMTEEERRDYEEHIGIPLSDEDAVFFDCKMPENGQPVLVTVKVGGHERVRFDEYYDDFGGCYLDSDYEIGTEVVAWMPLPEAWKGETE